MPTNNLPLRRVILTIADVCTAPFENRVPEGSPYDEHTAEKSKDGLTLCQETL